MKNENIIEVKYKGQFKITWKQIKEVMPYLLFLGVDYQDLSELILAFINV